MACLIVSIDPPSGHCFGAPTLNRSGCQDRQVESQPPRPIAARRDDPRVIKRIGLWDDFKEAWIANRPAIDAIRDDLTFLVSVEVLVPTDADDEEIVETFKSSLLEICAARNNNAELTLETKANQRGHYNEIKKALPAAIASRIEWKQHGWRRHKGARHYRLVVDSSVETIAAEGQYRLPLTPTHEGRDSQIG